jgi:uroporphyrinogen-III decarboxylase
MDNIQDLYEIRAKESKKLIEQVFSYENKEIPFIINTANYFTFGYDTNEIPQNYFTESKAMYKRQAEQFTRHYNIVKDDYVPYLMPWFGTGVLASGFGTKIIFNGVSDPGTEGYVIESVDDINRLKVPNPEKDGLMPRVLEQLDFFSKVSEIPACITDSQGPLTTAIQLCGYEQLFYWFYDHPKAVHDIMDIVTEAFIKWVKAQKAKTGEPLNHCFGNQGVFVPEGVGIWLSDDDAILMPPDIYEEFVFPYNDKIFKAFGGGVLHYCGSANQQIENFLSMRYLKGINNFSLGNIKELLTLKKEVGDKLVIIACDFTPLRYEEYFSMLFDSINTDSKGLIIQSLFLPTIGLEDGRYEIAHRKEEIVVPDLSSILKKYCRHKK